MPAANISAAIAEFQDSYNANAKDSIWLDQSLRFKEFWKNQIEGKIIGPISDVECDPIIRILDRNGKGNTKDSEAVAKAMIPQGAWRRMLNEFHTNKKLGSLVKKILESSGADTKAALIDELYELNDRQKNNLTGPSGNAVGAFLAAYDPISNLSIISLKDRRALIDFLNVPLTFDWDAATIGQRIAGTNSILLDALRKLGISGSARTASVFCYFEPMKSLWKGEHTVKREDKSVSVTVPTVRDGQGTEDSGMLLAGADDIRESMQVQAMLARIGTSMGFSIWLPRGDKGRVLKVWNPSEGELLEELPLGYDSTTMKTIEQIDVLWIKRRSIVRAFEVEHTTSVYSGLLRMADLIALQPNINIKLHIVAPDSKREKVFQEIRRPVFALLEGRPLNDVCTFLSYDSVREIAETKHLAHLSDSVIADYEEAAE